MKNRPIFIVGAPRSGTTLLQYMLRSHPTISLPTGESHFIIPLYKNANNFGDLSQRENVKLVLQAMADQSAEFLYTDLHGLKFDIEELADEFFQDGRQSIRDVITGLFEKNSAGEGKQRWGDKTPYYVLHIPKILEWWPNAQIIHLIRDGRDVALSILERSHDFGIYNFYIAAEQWQKYAETGRKLGKDIPPEQYLELRYEEILEDQAAAIRRVCEFLDETYSEELLNFKKASIAGKTPFLQKPIQKNNQAKWKSAMNWRQLCVFESVASNSLQSFGYDTKTRGTKLHILLRAYFRWHNALLTLCHSQWGQKHKKWAPLPRR